MGRNTDSHRYNLQQFHRKSKILLNDVEKDFIHDLLKQYESYKDVKKLVQGLAEVLNTPAKRDLLVEIRGLVPRTHLAQFDWLAPYSTMAHPAVVLSSSTGDSGRGGGSQRVVGGTESNGSVRYLQVPRNDGSVRGINGFHDNAGSLVSDAGVRMVTIDKDTDALGFGIRGGSESGTGIFIDYVEPGSVEESLGLGAGDQIIEVNNISFDNITTGSATMVLQGNSRLRMKIKQTGGVMGQRMAKEKTSWYDTVQRTIVAGEFNDIDPSHTTMGGTRLLSGGDERRVIITLTSQRKCIGFNIRGGIEYGVGIYVSKVDQGGLAEAHGITVGDQIIDVNGVSTGNTTHVQAVDLIRNQRCLIMTIRSVNRYPAYKEICGWTNTDNISKSTGRQSSSSLTSATTPLLHNELIDAIPLEVAEQYTQTHAHNESRDWLPNQSVTMSPTPIPKSSRSSVATETVSLIQKHIALPEKEVNPIDRSQQADKQSSNQEVPVDTGNQTVNEVSNGQKRIGRSHSMKFPGEKALPVFEADNAKKDGRHVQRNRTFREVLFGMKMKSKYMKSDKQEKKKVSNDPKHLKKKHPPATGYASLNKRPAELKPGPHYQQGGSVGRTEAFNINWAIRNDTDFVASSIPGSIARRRRPKPASIVTQRPLTNQGDSVPATHQPIAFTHGAGTQLMYSEVKYASAMSVMEDMGKRLLSEDEQSSVMRHVRWYHQEGRIENIVPPLLAILDKPEKILLLREIRGVISPSDLGRFDSMVSRRELQAYEVLQLGRKDPSQPMHSMRRNSIGKPRKTLLETKMDQEGKFHLRTRRDIEQDQRRKRELEELRRENERKESMTSFDEDDAQDSPTNSLHNSDIAMGLFDRPDVFGAAGTLEASSDEKIMNAGQLEPLFEDEVFLETAAGQSAVTAAGLKRSSSDLGRVKPESPELRGSDDPKPQLCSATIPRSSEDNDSTKRGDDSREDRIPNREMYGVNSSDDDVDLATFGVESSGSDTGSDTAMRKPIRSGLYDIIRASGDTDNNNSVLSDRSSSLWSSPSDTTLPPTPITPQPSPDAPHSPPPSGEPIYAKVNMSLKRSKQQPGGGLRALSVEGSSLDGSLDGSESGRRSPYRVTFTDYRSTPGSSRKGILKNSFRSKEAAPIQKRQFSSDYMDIEDINLSREGTCQGDGDEMVDQLRTAMETMTVLLNKNLPSLGISVSGGRDSTHQPEVRIDQIFPGGAASEDGRLRPSCELISIDGEPLEGVTHPQAVDIIRKAYHDKTKQTIEFIVKQPAEVDTHL